MSRPTTTIKGPTRLLWKPDEPGARFRVVFEGTYRDAVKAMVEGQRGSYWVHDQVPADEKERGLFDDVQ